MLILPQPLVGALTKLWEEQPEKVRSLGWLFVKDEQPVMNVTKRICDHFVDGQCVVDVRHLVRGKGKFSWEDYSLPLIYVPRRDNPEWGERGDEYIPTVDYKETEQLQDELDQLKRSLHGAGKHVEAFRTTSLYSLLMEEQGCTKLVDNQWVTCPFFSGIKVIEAVLESELSDADKAKAILRFYIRPSRMDSFSHLPKEGSHWSENDLRTGRVVLAKEALFQMQYEGKDSGLAVRTAYAIMHNLRPEYFKYRDAQKQVRLESTLEARIYATALLRRNDVQVAPSEGLNAYRQMVDKVGGYLVPNLLSGCPITLTVPIGKFAAKIVRQTVVTDRLLEIKAEDAWIRCGKVSMPATGFNTLKWESRKRLLGCECKNCIQEDIYSVQMDADGLYRFMLNAESLLTEEKTSAIADTAANMLAIGSEPISDVEVDWLQQSMRYLEPDLGEIDDPHTAAREEIEDDDELVSSFEHPPIQLNEELLEGDLGNIVKNGQVESFWMYGPEWARENRKSFFRFCKQFKRELTRKQARESLESRHQLCHVQIHPRAFVGEKHPGRSLAMNAIKTLKTDWDEMDKTRKELESLTS